MFKNKIKFTKQWLLLALTCATIPAAAQVTMPDQTYVLPTTATVELGRGTFNSSLPYITGQINIGQQPVAIPLVSRFNATWNQTYADIPYDVATQGYNLPTIFVFNQTDFTNTYNIAVHPVITDLSEYKDTNYKSYVLAGNKGNFDAVIEVAPLKVQLDHNETWDADGNIVLLDFPHNIFKEITVNDRASFYADTLNISTGGSLTLNSGGTVSVDKIENYSGTFDWAGGLLILKDGLKAYSSAQWVPSIGNYTIASGRGLELHGDSLIHKVDGLVINGGYLTQDGHLLVTQQGSLNHSSGTIIYGSNSVTEFAGISKGYFGEAQNIGRGATLKIHQESDVTMKDAIRLSNATLLVDGYSSTLTTNTGLGLTSYSSIGNNSGGTTTATFKNTGRGYFQSNNLFVGNINYTGTATLHIQSGAQVTTKGLRIGPGQRGNSTVNISGVNSKLIQNSTPSSSLYLGSESNSDTNTSIGRLNLASGLLQTANYSNDVFMRIMHNGIANIYGGTLDARNHVDVIGGTINHTSGSFVLAANKRLSFTEAGQGNFVGEQHFNSGKRLNVADDSDVTYSGKLIMGQSSGGTLIVDGPGSTLTLGNNTIASTAWGDGTGTTNATFSNNSSTNINYALTNLGVTSNSSGSINFNVQSGAIVNTNSLALGTDRGLNSTINIDGTNSKLTLRADSALTAGGANSGWTNINITNGGQLTTGTGDSTIQQKGLLNLAAGTLTLNGNLNVNATRLEQTAGNIFIAAGKALTFNDGRGTLKAGNIAHNNQLNINAGASVLATNLQTGGTATGDGSINIDDFDSRLTPIGSAPLTIGGGTGSGLGTLNLNDGWVRTMNNPATINDTGTLNINGGKFDTLTNLNFNGGTINIDGGLLDMLNHTITRQSTDNQINLLAGDLVNVRSIGANLNHQGGNLKNELTTYDLNIDGNYTMGDLATLTLSLTAADQIDGLTITGDATLDGHLELFDAAYYNAKLGDQFEIISANSITGKFDSIVLPSLNPLFDLIATYESNRVILTVVTKVEDASLTIAIAAASIAEGDGSLATTASVSRNTATTSALTVLLASNDTTEATVPASVTIAAGQITSPPFNIAGVVDAFVDGTQTVTITASAAAHLDGTDTLDVTDDDVPSLTVTIIKTSIGEADGSAATTATVSRNTDNTSALTVSLASNDTTEATVPASITIAAGQSTSAPFNIASIDDEVADGTQTVTITASAAAHSDGIDTLDVTDTFDVTDDDVPSLTVAISNASIGEADGSSATTATVSRNTDTTSALTVSLTSNDLTEATVPASITIAAGQTISAPFNIAAIDDAKFDGTQTVTITASAAAHDDGIDTLDVTDDGEPLVINISAASINEGDGSLATTATVSRNTDTTSAQTVSLASNDLTEATVPASITIAAGQSTSEPFNIAAIDDTELDGTQTVTITASAAPNADGTAALEVNDNNLIPTITSAIADQTNLKPIDGVQQLIADLKNNFNDANGDALTFTTSSSDSTAVASTTSGSNGITLSLEAKRFGTATITVRATSIDGFVEDTFTVKTIGLGGFTIVKLTNGKVIIVPNE